MLKESVKSKTTLSSFQIVMKRMVDITASFLGLVFLGWLILLVAFLSFLDTHQNGFFVQKRVGQYGRIFSIYKIRTLQLKGSDFVASKFGEFLRKSKLDELPQLWNVFIGNMSLVGPRPDLPGFADKLEGEDQLILTVKPGITGPATLYFKNEEILLEKATNAEKYNQEILWPKKVEMNFDYVKNYSLWKDVKYLVKTIF